VLPSTVDKVNKKVTCTTNHFSLFQIMQYTPAGGVSAGKVGPNPFRPAKGHTVITFSNLPAATTLKAYTITGELVRTLTANGSGTALWDGKNGAGADAASGVYFVRASAAGGGDKIFKVAIQR
jgi:hypothetical protein